MGTNRRPRTAAAVASLGLLGLACGDGIAEGGAGLSVTFSLVEATGPVPCADVPEVSRVEATLFSEDGRSVRPGFPRPASCSTSRLDAPDVFFGDHLLELRALGSAAGGENAVLFRGRATLTLPEDNPANIELQPEAGFVTVRWAFDGVPDECLGVDVVDVTLTAAGASEAILEERLPCDSRSGALARPVPPGVYRLDVAAVSPASTLVAAGRRERIVVAGRQTLDLVLTPPGGELLLDWSFLVPPSAETRRCRGERLLVDEVRARVRATNRGVVFDETFSCTAPRPERFSAARFLPGESLELELSAEGTIDPGLQNPKPASFRAARSFTMPEGNWDSGELTLLAVGTASITVAVVTSTCSNPDVDRYEIELASLDSLGQPVLEATTLIRTPATSTVVDSLPFGLYRVTLQQKSQATTLCELQGEREVTERENIWLPFLF